MAPSPAPAPPPAAPPFKYVGGRPCLDFVNTVDWLDRGGVDHERLTDYHRLLRWAQEAGISSAAVAARLRRRGDSHPATARAAVETAWRLRWALRGMLRGVATGAPSPKDIAAFDAAVGETLARLQVVLDPRADAAARWGWRAPGDHLVSPLWPVVWDAALLLTSLEARRLRVCAGPDCGWMYVDRSRNGMRRWCQMATCGTQAKSRRRARRRRPDA